MLARTIPARRAALAALILVAFCCFCPAVRAELVADKPWSYAPPNGDPAMLQRHEAIVQQVRKTPDAQVVFIGDSITQGWEGAGKAVWDKFYAPRKALNLGIAGDRTQGCLWRLDNGELDGIKPRLAVILMGTNNTWGDEVPVDANIRGIRMVVETVRRKQPQAKVLLLALLPREDPNTNGKWKLVNGQLEKIQFGDGVEYLDIGQGFLDAQGRIARGYSGDKLHLAPEGYQLWADAIEPRVAAALGEKPAAPPKAPAPQAAAAPAGQLRRFDARTVEQAEAWQRESLALMAADKKMTPWLDGRRAAGPDKDYGLPLAAKTLKQADKGKFTRREVAFAVFDNWTANAIVTVPKGTGPFPAVVFIESKPERPYEGPGACGTVLAEAGYVTLSLDVQGDKVHKPELGGHERLVPGIRAVDYLCTLPEVDKDRIGAAGLCRWGALAVFDAILDPRLRAVATSAVLFKDAPAGRYYATINNQPHDFRDCYAMLAPRPLLVQLGQADGYKPLFPGEQDLAESRKAYAVFGCPERMEVFNHPGGHLIEAGSLPGFFERAFAAKTQ